MNTIHCGEIVIPVIDFIANLVFIFSRERTAWWDSSLSFVCELRASLDSREVEILVGMEEHAESKRTCVKCAVFIK